MHCGALVAGICQSHTCLLAATKRYSRRETLCNPSSPSTFLAIQFTALQDREETSTDREDPRTLPQQGP